MTINNSFEIEIADFLARQNSLTKEDQKTLLMNIFSKHVLMNQADLVMSAMDLEEIVSSAKAIYPSIPVPCAIGKKDLSADRIPHLCTVEAVILFLNKNQALRRLPKFNRR